MKMRIALAALLLAAASARAADYLPPPGDAWATHKPAREGFDAAKLKSAIDFAVAHETKLFPALDGTIDPRDLRVTIPLQFAGPFSDPIGPLKPHAPLNGIVIRHGYIVADGATRVPSTWRIPRPRRSCLRPRGWPSTST
jgi:hypothetical protein